MRLSSALALLLLAVPAFAQQGTVRYEMTVKIDIELPPEMASFADQIPKSQSIQKLLFFDETASLMKNMPQVESAEESRGGRMMRFMMGGRSDNQTYTDLDMGTMVEKNDFLGRTFLIQDDAPALAWRLTDEQAEFLGYPCFKATTTVRDTVEVEAWFTSQIPVSAGPENYSGLPGLILVVIEDGGQRTFIAKDVTLEAPPVGTIVAPTEGRRVTRAEFATIQEEKMEEMRQQGGGRFMMGGRGRR